MMRPFLVLLMVGCAVQHGGLSGAENPDAGMTADTNISDTQLDDTGTEPDMDGGMPDTNMPDTNRPDTGGDTCVSTGPEQCDGVDNDCNGSVDERPDSGVWIVVYGTVQDGY